MLMTTLEVIQRSFYESIFQDNLKSSNFISSTYPSARLDIYRQTIIENMRNALSLTFPGIWKLLGEECANSVSYAFIKNENNLPFSGCLDDWGDRFPDFLGQLIELKELPYLKDYAFYEWLKHKSYGELKSMPIHNADLEAIPVDQIGTISFSFISSMFTFTSDFPIDEIQVIAENSEANDINLNLTKVYAIIVRPNDAVLTYWISQDLWYFYSDLKQGQTISKAFNKAHEQFPDFDLTQAIHFLLQKQLICNIVIKNLHIQS